MKCVSIWGRLAANTCRQHSHLSRSLNEWGRSIGTKGECKVGLNKCMRVNTSITKIIIIESNTKNWRGRSENHLSKKTRDRPRHLTNSKICNTHAHGVQTRSVNNQIKKDWKQTDKSRRLRILDLALMFKG